LLLDPVETAYDRDLEALDRGVSQMGGIAEKMVIDAMHALTSADAGLANRVIASDAWVDSLQREIENQAILTNSKREPMAVDLREIIGAIRVAGDLERVGDLAKNIARRALEIGRQSQLQGAIAGLRRLGDVATELMSDTLDAYAQRDGDLARAVWQRQSELDANEDSVFRDLLTYMMEDAGNIPFCTHLLFCSKNLERIGEHAANIAETVHFVVTASTLAGQAAERLPA
jgi:phosphate transport system protein